MGQTKKAWCLLSVTLLAHAGLSGCDSGGTECACPVAGLTVDVPQVLASGVTAITPSGLACQGAAVTPTPGPNVVATQFHIEPRQTGPCQIDVLFADGTTFEDDLTVIETTGCCAGFRTDPPGAADIAVPAPFDAASVDSGSDD